MVSQMFLDYLLNNSFFPYLGSKVKKEYKKTKSAELKADRVRDDGW